LWTVRCRSGGRRRQSRGDLAGAQVQRQGYPIYIVRGTEGRDNLGVDVWCFQGAIDDGQDGLEDDREQLPARDDLEQAGVSKVCHWTGSAFPSAAPSGRLVCEQWARTTEASTKAYSKSALRSSSCRCRNAAFLTSRKRARWTVCEAGRCSRATVSRDMVLSATGGGGCGSGREARAEALVMRRDEVEFGCESRRGRREARPQGGPWDPHFPDWGMSAACQLSP
jgi:hypothetical protein